MDRRNFLQGLAATAASLEILPGRAGSSVEPGASALTESPGKVASGSAVSVEGHSLVAEFKVGTTTWKVLEDLRTREGLFVFLASTGESRVAGQERGSFHAGRDALSRSRSHKLMTDRKAKSVTGHVELTGAAAPEEVHFKLRLPKQMPLESVAVNGQPATRQGIHKDTVTIKTSNQRKFEIVGRLG